MKKLSILFMSMLAMATTLTFTSCEDDDNDPAPPANTTALELIVKDAQGVSLISGATVKLYANQTDWQQAKNQIGATQTTDDAGKVKFTNLEAKQYFFSVTRAEGCLSNVLTIPVTYNPSTMTISAIEANKTTSLPIPVIGTTDVTFTNESSTNEWLVTIGENEYYTIPTGFSGPAAMPTGAYTITMQELDSNGNPTSTAPKTFDVDLECGETTTVVVP